MQEATVLSTEVTIVEEVKTEPNLHEVYSLKGKENTKQ